MEVKMTKGAAGATVRFSARFATKLQLSANILRNEGALRFLELSALSLSAPVRSLRLRIAVSADARNAILKIKNGRHGRGVFIDCGSNVGQGYNFFSKYYTKEYFDYVMVEPNSICLPYLQALRASSGANIEIINKAASVRSGFAKLFGPPPDQHEPTYEGRSIVREHNNSLYDTDSAGADIVEIFSLSRLIMEKSVSYDAIILKMDIEGAEYDVLPDLINSGAHRELYASYIEFHSAYMNKDERYMKQKIEYNLKKLIKSDNVLFREWI